MRYGDFEFLSIWPLLDYEDYKHNSFRTRGLHILLNICFPHILEPICKNNLLEVNPNLIFIKEQPGLMGMHVCPNVNTMLDIIINKLVTLPYPL